VTFQRIVVSPNESKEYKIKVTIEKLKGLDVVTEVPDPTPLNCGKHQHNKYFQLRLRA
jgi:hypothetical protein